MKLLQQIEHGKHMLRVVARMYGRTSPEAVRYSQALDKLIAKYQLFLFRKAMMAA